MSEIPEQSLYHTVKECMWELAAQKFNTVYTHGAMYNYFSLIKSKLKMCIKLYLIVFI